MNTIIPRIENPHKLPLKGDLAHVLQQMFVGYQRLVLKQEFNQGFSGSRIFLVRPIKDEDSPELRAVAKLAPHSLINKEWWAYKNYIHHKLPRIAQIDGEPILPENSAWGGLRYTMLGGGGTFEIESLKRYFDHASLKELAFVVEEQLLPVLKQMWQVNRTYPEFHIATGFDSILPVNLLIDPNVPLPPQVTPITLNPNTMPHQPLKAGDYISLTDFAITRVDLSSQRLTLNVPAAAQVSYTIRLQAVANIVDFLDQTVIKTITGQVVETRYERLRIEIQRIIGLAPLGKTLILSDSSPLPNPLSTLPTLLNKSRDVKVSCIHGDLNLENIMVHPQTRTVNLIDFAEARQDYVLHDFLRLETEVLVKIMPDLLASDSDLPQTLATFFQQLQALSFQPEVEHQPIEPFLQKPLGTLMAIRKAAQNYFLDPQDATEYYEGLIIYLLGVLKFKNLSLTAKQVAFWMAALTQSQLTPLVAPALQAAKRPQQIGRYEILSLLGQGGMGKVYRALDPDLDREVVLKLISLPASVTTEEWKQRFKREVQAAARFSHPFIVTVHDVDLEHKPPYVVMELLTGGTLKERLDSGPLFWSDALTLLRPLVEALAHAHQAGIIHRDIKPANIMFTHDETLKLVDFGLARSYEGDDQLTHPEQIVGTPTYMSPEQVRGEAVDIQADIFALGIIILETITHSNPLKKGSLISTLSEVGSDKPVDTTLLNTGKIPLAVIQLIKKAVAKDKPNRYPTCQALLADLDHCLAQVGRPEEKTVFSTPPPISRPEIEPEVSPQPAPKSSKLPLWIAGAVVAVLLLLGLVFMAGGMAWFFNASSTVTSQVQVASLVNLKPKVEIKRANTQNLEAATFGMPLYPADVINTYADASASVICENGLLFSLSEQSNLTIDCQDSDDSRLVGRIDSTLSQQIVIETQVATDTLAMSDTRALPNQKNLPLLLSPRNTFIRAESPTFRWQPVPGASGYRLTLSLAGGETWTEETAQTSLPYPSTAIPLPSGSVNIVRLTTLDNETEVDKSLLRVLEEADQKEVERQADEIQSTPVDSGTKHYLLAQLYQQYNLSDAAIEQLKELLNQQDTPAPELLLQLGDLYLKIELYTPAQDSYLQALTNAETTGDLNSQAVSQVRLARLSQRFGDSSEAIEYLTAAEALYREADQTDLADSLAAELADLEP